LISAPFSPLEHPSLGLSLLRETVRGHRPPIVYLTIPFAECIGASLYDWISNGNPSFKSLVGEWIFGYALHAVHRPEAYLAEVLGEDTLRWFQETTEEDRPLKLIDTLTLAELRSTVEIARACVDDWAAQIAALRPRVVAFTSVFQQHAASLALAKRLKTLDPQIVTLFGGSNCESEMGRVLVESYDFVDVVVSGEAEVIFPEVVARLLDGRDVRGLPGVHADGLLSAPGNTPSPVINDLPYPDYDDFFEQWRRSSIADTIQPRLLFETSRGCWWGEKNHCTFCGLNGESMAFRSKRPERALAELAWLSDRYPGHEVAAVDNILDMKYFPTFVRELAARRTKTALFYEVKANLKKEQVALLREAGVLHLQPGVESLSDHILALMRKGVSALQNIQLIKWCTQFGIVSYWNVLWGFPGETAEDYQRMTTLVPLLTHLTPPSGAGPIRLDRFSPNHFDATRLGLTRVRAARAYSFVYELDPGKLDRLAYFFDFEYANHRGKELEDAIGRLWQELEHWRSVHEASRLVHVPTDEGMLVFDSRPCAVDSVHLLEGVDRTVFERCDQLQGIAALANAIGSERDALDAIERLIARRLLVGGDGRFLTPSLCARTLSRARTDVVD
jgi:ribosomal peptide maturation radical SAM protein 1